MRLAPFFALALLIFLPQENARAIALIQKNIAYGRDRAQTLNIYTPPQARGAPVIVMVRGEAWRTDDKAGSIIFDSKQARWQSRGFVFISVNYRRLPAIAPLEQARDLALAIATAQDQAEQWGADRNKFILVGHAAGAHLAALLAANPQLARMQGATPWLGSILLDSAALDVPAVMNARHLPQYDQAFGKDPAYWQNASPFHQLRPGGAPMLVVCSLRRPESCPIARRFVARAVGQGRRAAVLSEDLAPGEINTRLGEESEYTAAVEAFMRGLDRSVAQALK